MHRGYTVDEVAKKLRVSKRTILREINRGKLHSQKAGRKYLISEKHLKMYLDKDEGNVEKTLSKFFKSKKTEMVNLLQKMVSLPSVGYDSNQEIYLAEFVNKQMQDMGIRSVLMREGNAIAVRGSYGYADKGIVIDCPLDTAPVGDIRNWEYPPFGGVIKAGKMYGRGTADCKAGIVSAIYSLLGLKQTVDENKIRLELIFDGGEQDGSYKGMEMVVKRGLHADAGIIGYAGDEFELAIGCRGYHRYTFTTKGKSTHTGARYNLGINAIEKMVDFIKEMYAISLPKSKNIFYPFGNKMTFSMINGGREINVVPDECTARLDFRTTPDYSKKLVDKLIEETINKIKKKDKNFEVDWKYDLGNEGYIVDEKDELIKLANESIKTTYKRKALVVANGPSHIGTILARYGIPTIVWGPRGGNVHSYNEYVEIDSIPMTSKIYADTVLKYFERKKN
ncbi:M20/M25/M40 family metallo-hydrolase [Patescibacteria group bacterium]|nr:M20/M25/M40 family metallo-hydrolase [Patescibacteria group bacterium]